MGWTADHNRRYRDEVERRFRERTPAVSVCDVAWEYRVSRGEMRVWALDEIGLMPPEIDHEWIQKHALWYKRMALGAMRKLGEI